MVRGGHAQIPQHHKREPGFFAIKIGEHFDFEPRWYHAGEVSGLVLEYYYVLRSVLGEKPHLRPCLTRCRHCGIAFLTHPRNAGRTDLGCPFGCREEHRKRRSTQRSTAYYRTDGGKMKRKKLNEKRSERSCKSDSTTTQDENENTSEKTLPEERSDPRPPSPQQLEKPAAPEPGRLPRVRAEGGDSGGTAAAVELGESAVARREADTAAGNRPEDDSEVGEELEFDEGTIEHVQLLGSLIDRVQLSREETIQLLRRVMRQHSIATETGLDYAVRQVKENPP